MLDELYVLGTALYLPISSSRENVMRIVIDLQAGQGHSGLRGIGRYSRSLAAAMAKLATTRGHDVRVVLNGNMPDLIPSIRQQFDMVLPAENVVAFPWHGATSNIDPDNAMRASLAERMREEFIASLKPDVVHVASLFEGYVDDVVVSVNETVDLPTAVTFYDLIPYVLRDLYMTDPRYQAFYFRRLDALKRARALLAISEHSKDEAVALLGIDPHRITNVSAAVSDMFRPIKVSDADRRALLHQYGIRDGFILYVPGGFDPRKNFPNLLKAYALLPPQVRARHQLVIGSKIYPNEIGPFNQIRLDAGLSERDVVLTGYLPDDDLVALFNLCAVHVFPSLHEGFGLPVLEGLACGAPSIGSNATSTPEVIGRSDALFDPKSPDSIATKLYQVISDGGFKNSLRDHALTHSHTFSWERSASRALDALEAEFGSHSTRGGAHAAVGAGSSA